MNGQMVYFWGDDIRLMDVREAVQPHGDFHKLEKVFGPSSSMPESPSASMEHDERHGSSAGAVSSQSEKGKPSRMKELAAN